MGLYVGGRRGRGMEEGNKLVVGMDERDVPLWSSGREEGGG